MSTRVGIDLVSVEEVRDSIRAHRGRYLERVYTQRELDDCRSPDGGVHPERLAARFAAKEAVLKVLRPEATAIPWRSIGVRRRPGGWPDLELSGEAAARAAESGLEQLSVSLTHEGGVAGAVVAAEVRSPLA